MRLLERSSDGEFSLTKDIVQNLPAYAILSHTWGDDDDEVTYDDMMHGNTESKAGGYRKIRFCGEQAARDGLRYFWVDTCCINKTDAIEVQKSINSMYRWYKDAAKCYVYLSDVSISDESASRASELDFDSALRSAKWFTRGWTLQELLAPSSVEFFSADNARVGDKRSLERLIHQRTGVPIEALRGYDQTRFSIDERIAWAEKRETKHEEDMAYSLLGIFGIFLPLIYGEGKDNAFRRLRKEVSQISQSQEFHSLSISGTRDQPSFTVPFVRDSKFVGREDILQEITNRLEMSRRIALCGIGGIGKTQIAIEYCYVWKFRHPNSHIFWVHASTFDRFAQAYRDIAKEMSIPGTEDPRSDILILVRDWLSKPENGSWLLVLDNADALDLFYEIDPSATKASRSFLSNLLPRNDNGSMIITTRDSRLGHRLTDRGEVVKVPPLSLAIAEELLRSKIPSGDNVNIQSIHDLVEILGCIPLAITQAAAFVQENDIALETYLARLKDSDHDLQEYLEEDLPDPRRYPDSENSVIRTWKLSFNHIAQQRPRAAELLSIMVMLDRQAIPKSLLKQSSERNIDFDRAVGTLHAYSLIKTEKSGVSFEIHRLVQLSTQRWLTLQNRRSEWEKKALDLIDKNFPNGEYGTWEKCEILLPHAKCVTKYTYTDRELILRRATLLSNIARYDKNRGRFEDAYLQIKDVLQVRENELGETHPDTLVAMSNVALALQNLSRYTEAESMNRNTLELKKKILGKTHREVLISMDNLGLVLNQQGKYTEAEIMTRRALKLWQESLGESHPDTLVSMNNLGLILEKQKKYVEAETIHRQTLERQETVLSNRHPEILTTMNNLAVVLEKQEKYTEAENIHRETLEIQENALGKSHQNTLLSVQNLAYLQGDKEEYEEASTLYERACAGFKSSLGPEHPNTQRCIHLYLEMLDGIKDANEAQKTWYLEASLRWGCVARNQADTSRSGSSQ